MNIPESSIKITKSRHELLERKERAHDDYLEAMRRLRENAARLALRTRVLSRTPVGISYVAGYQGALMDLSQHIVDIGNEREPDSEWDPRVQGEPGTGGLTNNQRKGPRVPHG